MSAASVLPSVFVFGGSRSLLPSWALPVASVVRSLVSAGVPSFGVGCARGGDEFALSALVAAGAAPRAVVFAVGDASGAGFWSGSAVAAVRSAAAAGAAVRWAAGGPVASVPLRARLVSRARACVALAAPGGAAVFWLGSPASPGSLGAAAAAALGGAAVFVFCCGFASGRLPLLVPGAGGWAPVVAGPLAGACAWLPLGGLLPPWCLPGGVARGGLSRRAAARAASASGRPAAWFVGGLGGAVPFGG